MTRSGKLKGQTPRLSAPAPPPSQLQLQTQTIQTSTASSMPMPCNRNFPTALADMQDVYGLMGNTPTPVHTSRAANAPSKSSSSQSFSFSRFMRRKEHTGGSEPSTSTPTASRRSSVDSQRTLIPAATPSISKSTPAPRDYEAALGALSSSYGFSGGCPTAVPVPTQPTLHSKPKSTSRRKADRSTPGMDERTANLGKLLSQYGAGPGPSMGGARR